MNKLAHITVKTNGLFSVWIYKNALTDKEVRDVHFYVSTNDRLTHLPSMLKALSVTHVQLAIDTEDYWKMMLKFLFSEFKLGCC